MHYPFLYDHTQLKNAAANVIRGICRRPLTDTQSAGADRVHRFAYLIRSLALDDLVSVAVVMIVIGEIDHAANAGTTAKQHLHVVQADVGDLIGSDLLDLVVDLLTIGAVRGPVGLGDQLTKKPNQMSGGQMQRVAIARALVNDPDIVLADEPTGALDSKTSRDILVLLEEINAKYNTTMLIVTHNNSIKNMVHKVVIIKDGQISKDYENETRTPAMMLEDL